MTYRIPEPPRWVRDASVWCALAAILGVGLTLRAMVMPRLGNVFDSLCFYEWASASAERGVPAVYREGKLLGRLPVNYPPVFVYVLSVLPRLHDACTSGDGWADPAIADGLRREALRPSLRDFAETVHGAGAEQTPLSAGAYAGAVADMEFAGLGDEFRAARVRTYGDYLGFITTNFFDLAHVGARHRSVLTFLKLPAVAGDLALATLVLLAGWRWANRWRGVLAAGAVFLNPVVIHNSSSWGQVDSIPTALGVACLLALLSLVWWLAGLLLAVALLTKMQALVFAPVAAGAALAFLAARRDARDSSVGGAIRQLAVALATACAGTAIILAPLARAGALGALVDVYRGLGSQYPFLTIRALNLWWLATNGDLAARFELSPPDDVAWALGVTPKSVGLGMLLVVAVVALTAIVRRRGDRATVVLAALTLAMAFFCLPTEIHERYGYPIVPLAVVAALTVRSRYWWVAAVASLDHFANLVLAGLADRPGGLPSGGLMLALASAPALTYAIALANLALLAFTFGDLWRTSFGGKPKVRVAVGTAPRAGTTARRRGR